MGYLSRVGWREHEALATLREATDRLPESEMRSATEQVALLSFLIELVGAQRVLEIGCFTGYATLGMALALPAGGHIVTLDSNAHWPSIGQKFWREAGVVEKIRLEVSPAEQSLAKLLEEGAGASFDVVYIDADKNNYEVYFDRALSLLRHGGLIALDNVLWHGAVADPADRSRQTEALRRLTRRINEDPAVAMVLLPIGDGLLLVRKR
jgi:predicted O-methyltransferase YrrM